MGSPLCQSLGRSQDWNRSEFRRGRWGRGWPSSVKTRDETRKQGPTHFPRPLSIQGREDFRSLRVSPLVARTLVPWDSLTGTRPPAPRGVAFRLSDRDLFESVSGPTINDAPGLPSSAESQSTPVGHLRGARVAFRAAGVRGDAEDHLGRQGVKGGPPCRVAPPTCLGSRRRELVSRTLRGSRRGGVRSRVPNPAPDPNSHPPPPPAPWPATRRGGRRFP